jgi:hypothetical protein
MDATTEAEASAEGWVPGILAEALSLSGLSWPAPQTVTMETATLFIDIAGFSRFSAALAGQSARSAEEVERLVDAALDGALRLIAAHGGQVGFMAGDAVLALWTKAGSGLHAARARACAMAIAALHDLANPARTEAMAGLLTRLCLDGGEVSVTFAGGHGGRWYGVLGGPPIEALADVARNAEPGQPYRTAAFRAIEAQAGVAAELCADPANQTVGPPPGGLAAFLPEWLAGRDGRLRPWLAEYRFATVVFLRTDASAAARSGVIQPFVLGCQAVVAGQNGAVLSLGTDDKGLMLVAAWGLAFNANEDDAERAVTAAEELAAMARGLALDPAIAVATGDMFAGQIGNNVFRQYSVLSHAVNVAASLLTRANGTILCDVETTRAAGRRFDFAGAGTFIPKGDRDPVPVFRPLRERPRGYARAPRMIGRRDELDAILALVARCGGDSEAGLLRVEANPGLGKSHIAAVASERMTEAGVTPLLVAADSLRQATPYHAWRRLIGQLADLPDTSDAAAVSARLSELLPDAAAQGQLPLLNPLLPAQLSETAATQALSPGARGQTTRELAAALLARCLPDGPACLVVEDAQWLDTPSWSLLVDSNRRLKTVGQLIMTRATADADLPSEAVAMLRGNTAQSLRLEPLEPAEIVAVVTDHLGVAELPPGVALEICDLAEGHPLYAKIAATLYVRTGRLVVVDGHSHVRNVTPTHAAISFGGGIRGLVTSRIANLGDAAQVMVKAASVQGRVFDRAVLARLLPDFVGDIDAGLAELCSSGLVDRFNETGGLPGAHARYRFHHAIILDTAYDLLLSGEQRRLHRIVAEAMTDNGDSEASDALLARHWERAGEPVQALVYLDRAARAAFQNQANREAVALCSRALAIAGPDVPAAQRGAWHMIAGEALRSLGNYLDAGPQLAAVMGLFDKAPPRTTGGKIGSILAGYGRLRLRGNAPPPAPARERSEILMAARANLTMGEICYDRQETPALLHHAFAGLNAAMRAGGASPELARGYMGMAMMSLHIPWAIDGDRFRDRALAVLETIRQPATASWVYMVAANYDFARARWDTAEDEAKASIDAAQVAREIKDWEVSVASLANIRRLRGRFRDSDTVDEEVYASGRDRGVPQVMLWALTGRVKSMVACNEFAVVDSLLDRMRALYRDELNRLNASLNNEIALCITSSICHLRSGHDDAAMADLNRVRDFYARLRDPQVYTVDAVGLILDAISALHRRRPDDPRVTAIAGFFAQKMRSIARIYPAAQARLMLARGDDAAIRGRHTTAVAQWRLAIPAAEALAMPYDAAMAEFRLSRASILGPDSRAGYAAACAERLAMLDMAEPACWSL